MKLEIRSFADIGDLSNERIVLKALADVDVGDYAVLRSKVFSGSETPTSGSKSAYWFPFDKVKANDVVVLYTKKGTRSTKPMDDGRTAHFFYWGKDYTLWVAGQFGAVLLEADEWDFSIPPEAPSNASE